MLIAFIIWTIVSLMFAAFSLYARCSKKPVGVFSNSPAPKKEDIKDVKAYNKAVSNMWLVFAIIFEIIGIPLLFLKQNSAYFIIPMLCVPFLTIITIGIFVHIEGKYKK